MNLFDKETLPAQELAPLFHAAFFPGDEEHVDITENFPRFRLAVRYDETADQQLGALPFHLWCQIAEDNSALGVWPVVEDRFEKVGRCACGGTVCQPSLQHVST